MGAPDPFCSLQADVVLHVALWLPVPSAQTSSHTRYNMLFRGDWKAGQLQMLCTEGLLLSTQEHHNHSPRARVWIHV